VVYSVGDKVKVRRVGDRAAGTIKRLYQVVQQPSKAIRCRVELHQLLVLKASAAPMTTTLLSVAHTRSISPSL